MSSKRTYANMCFPGLLLPGLLSPRQASATPRLCRRPSNTHKKAWFCILWGRCSFLLGPGVHKVLSVPSKCEVSFSSNPVEVLIKSHWRSKSDSLEIPNPFSDSQPRKPDVGPRNFTIVQELLWHYSPVCEYPTRLVWDLILSWLFPSYNLIVPSPLSSYMVCLFFFFFLVGSSILYWWFFSSLLWFLWSCRRWVHVLLPSHFEPSLQKFYNLYGNRKDHK